MEYFKTEEHVLSMQTQEINNRNDNNNSFTKRICVQIIFHGEHHLLVGSQSKSITIILMHFTYGLPVRQKIKIFLESLCSEGGSVQQIKRVVFKSSNTLIIRIIHQMTCKNNFWTVVTIKSSV
jgi:hypothetical protein